MLTCGQFLAEFGKQLEGDLPEELRAALEAHLHHCGTCAVVVDSTTKTIRIVTESGQFEFAQPLPESVVERVMRRVHAAAQASRAGQPEP